jgi:hypothetical protein
MASEESLHSSSDHSDREIVFLSSRGSRVVERADGVKFSRLNTGSSTAAKKAFMAQRQAYGQSVVYFGDCQLEPDLAAMADVAVTVANRHYQATAAAPIVFLSPDLAKFGSLHSLSQKRMLRSKAPLLWRRYLTLRLSPPPSFQYTSVDLCHYDNAGRGDLLSAGFPRFKASIVR